MVLKTTGTRVSRVQGHDAGMSLVEVVVAIVVLGILAASVLGVILKAQATEVNSRSRIAAASLAAREVDILRDQFGRTDGAPTVIGAQGPQVNQNPLSGGTAGQPLVIDGTAYTVTRTVAWNITGNGASACEGGGLVQYPTLAVSVAVTWPDMGTTQPVVARAQLAPKKGNGVPSTASFVAVKVVDSKGDPNPGRSVQVTATSESRSGVTDASGCAVIQVSPATSGTDYTAELNDSGYVDVSNAQNPSKVVGTMTPGQLNSSVIFAYDLAANVTIRLVDSSGVLVPAATAAASTVTLAAVGATGDTVTSAPAISGAVTTLTGLWPSTYGAYFGSTAPSGGYTTVAVAPGGTASLDVVFVLANGSISGMPAGTSTVIAVPGTAACTDPGATVVDPAGFTLVPGAWSFYATGPTFTCSPGPAGESFDPGPNDEVLWAASMLQVTGAPAGGTLWAVSTSTVAGTLVTCPGAAYAAVAVNVDAARTSSVTLPAGDWYVFRTDGAATGLCLGTPTGQYPKKVTYGGTTTISWLEVPLTSVLSVSGLDKKYKIVLSTATGVTCNSTTVFSAGTVATSTSSTSSNNASLSVTVDRPLTGTQNWYVYLWKTSGSKTCAETAGRFVVGPLSTALSKTNSSSVVGP